ncbi:MAG: hypothetical protein K6F07_03975 [Bacilli bacterium]|nr:hypothetical protein [Bacilli bacterium]
MKPLCIAHRGCHWKCFENTIQAFEAAKKGAFFGVEMDIHLTKDKKWVIHHDSDFLSEGKKYVIKDEKCDDLLKMPLDNEWNYEAFIPTLECYLMTLEKSGKRPIIEIKPKNPSFHQLRKVVKIVKKHFRLQDVDFIAFYPWPLFKLKFMYGKKIHLQQLVEHNHPFMVNWAYRYRFGLDIETTMLTKEMIERFHKKNLKVNAWCVDDEETLRKFEEWGIDYITTNKFDQNS